MIQTIRDVKECPDCASTNLVYMDEQDQVVCQDCQLVFEPLTPTEEARYETVHDFNPRERIIPRKPVETTPAVTSKSRPSPKRVVKKKVMTKKAPTRKVKKKIGKTVKKAKKKTVTRKGKKRR